MRRRDAARTVVAVLLTTGATACGPAAPDRLETSYVDVEVGEPTTLSLPQGPSSMWADAGSADAVTCRASRPGEASPTELLGHSRDLRVASPVTRDGQEFHTVGKLPAGPGEVTVECTGPDGVKLYAAISRAPE
jgi:hypothetical protein